MEKGFESWFYHQQTDWQSPNPNSLSAQFDFGHQQTVPPHGNAYANMLLPNGHNGNFPPFAFSAEQPHKASLPNEPRGWFYCMPRFRAVNSMPKEKLPMSENCNGIGASNGVQNRFLVFDQTGDNKTTLVFSSGIGAPVQCLPSWLPKPQRAFELKKEEVGIKGEEVHSYRPIPIEEYIEENEKSEMHEDTEELNALLYSDDEIDYSEDEEETSTGHSPSTMTGYDRPEECLDETGEEEVASSGGPAKRQKLVNGGYDVQSLAGTASSSSVKTDKNCFDEDDGRNQVFDELDSLSGNKSLRREKVRTASSSSVKTDKNCFDEDDGRNQVFDELDSLSGNKSLRREKVRETINVLQNLIPGGKKDKDAIVVLDEAIHYLRSLKVKAQVLGLD